MPTCDICGAPSNGLECDWPVEKFVTRPASQLKIGDEVRRFSHALGKRKTQGIARITDVWSPAQKLSGWQLRVEITITWPWKTAVRVIAADPNGEFMVKGNSNCGAHVCDACMIERDTDKMVICRTHWNAWELVA